MMVLNTTEYKSIKKREMSWGKVIMQGKTRSLARNTVVPHLHIDWSFGEKLLCHRNVGCSSRPPEFHCMFPHQMGVLDINCSSNIPLSSLCDHCRNYNM